MRDFDSIAVGTHRGQIVDGVNATRIRHGGRTHDFDRDNVDRQFFGVRQHVRFVGRVVGGSWERFPLFHRCVDFCFLVL